MPVKILCDGCEVEYRLSAANGNESLFLLQSEDGSEVIVEVPLALDNSFSDKNFETHFLCKRDIKESDIFQVYLKDHDKRVGWIIPINALSSSLHDYAENEHFLKYAFIAIRESLRHLNGLIFSNAVDSSDGRINFADIFHDFTAILIISRETLSEDVQFDIHRSTPSLIRYGYVQLGLTNPDRLMLIKDSPDSEKLKIEQISQSLNSEELISGILNNSFSVEASPVFKFFLLYQLFELLIEEVYRVEQTAIVDELILVKGDSGKMKEGLEKLRECLSEKSRLGLLLQKYAQPGVSLSELSRHCNSLLKNLGKEEAESFQNYFYRVRNFVFHQYRDFPDTESSSLENIVDELLEILPGILARFDVSGSNKL